MFRKHRRALLRTACLATAACAAQQAAQGEGFRNPPPGTFSLSRAGGRIAQVDNAEAAYHNPANVVDVGAQIEAAPGMVYFKVQHEDGTSETTDPVKFLPHAFFTTPIIPDKLAFGLALTTPFGISNEWDKDKGRFVDPNVGVTSWRYETPYFSELITINGNPSLSWRINDWVSIGAGVDLFWSQVTFKQYYPPLSVTIPGVGTFTSPETTFKAQGDGIGVGGNAGVTFKLTDKQRLAVTYRSPFSINYDGDLKFDTTPLGATQTSDFNTKIRFPTIVSVGYGIQLSDTVRLEADAEWLQFSRFENLALDAGDNNPSFGAESNRNRRQDWDNTFTAGIAADWRFADNWTVRGGYQYYETPVPDHTFSPTIPDSNQHAITAGIGFANGHHRAELAYSWVIYEDRDIAGNQNPVFNGHYEMNVHLFAASYAYHF